MPRAHFVVCAVLSTSFEVFTLPTSSIKRPYLVTSFSKSAAGAITSYSQTTEFVSSEKVFDETVYRALPKDLFLAATNRSTLSYIRNTSVVNSARNLGRDVELGKPAINMWAHDSIGVEPRLPDAPWESLLNEIRAELRQDGVNLAMAMAEYRQTAGLYAAASQHVANHGQRLMAALKTRRGIAKAWLGFQYGVKPHVSDVLGSIENLRNASAQPSYLHGRKFRKQTGINNQEVFFSSPYWPHYARLEFHRAESYRLKWRAKFKNSEVRNTLTRHGFTNPFALAYELIPYSFVLDWWVNVGDVLASLDNLLMFEELRCIKSRSFVTARYLTSPGYNNRVGTYLDPHSWTRIARQDVRSPAIAESMIATLKYKPSASATHIANGTALVYMARHGRSRN